MMKINPWLDTRLSQESMNFLWSAISEKNKKYYDAELTENIFTSEDIVDKDNWFFESSLKELTEKLFYRNWDIYYKYHIEKETPPPKFELNSIWVNYQKQNEFNPLHDHGTSYSFVIFMKIPTHWKEQHKVDLGMFRARVASDFAFVQSEKNSDRLITTNFALSSEDEGRMLFFPAHLQHLVYPFYGTDEERVTISGNIDIVPEKESEMVEVSGEDVYKQKENTLHLMEKHVEIIKEELKVMKKKKIEDGEIILSYEGRWKLKGEERHHTNV
jgi:hypothetical protein